MPYHELDNKVCLPCNIIEHCISCYGDKNYIFCSLCESGYDLKENKCQKKVVKNCIIGEKEKCRECSYIIKDQCESCNASALVGIWSSAGSEGNEVRRHRPGLRSHHG